MFSERGPGLREANVKLWDFEKLLWKRYTDILTSVVQRGGIPADQQVRIQAIADDVARAFGEVNTLLNDLAESRANDAASLRRRLKQAPERLTAALDTAGARLAKSESSTLKAFGPVIKASAKVAEDVAKLLQSSPSGLPGARRPWHCCDAFEVPLYEGLSGVRVRPLNILSRLQATSASGRPLIDGRNVKVSRRFRTDLLRSRSGR